MTRSVSSVTCFSARSRARVARRLEIAVTRLRRDRTPLMIDILELEPQQLAELGAQGHLLPGQPGRLGGGGDGDRELGVAGSTLSGRCGCGKPFEVAVEPLDLVRDRALRGQGGRDTGDTPADVTQLAKVEDTEPAEPGTADPADERASATSSAGDDQPLLAEHGQRLTKGHGRDAHLLGELRLRR